DGELGARQRKAVVRLLDESDEARSLLVKLERDAFLLRQLPQRKAPIDIRGAILDTIACEPPHRRTTKPLTVRRWVPNWARYGAGAAVVLAVGVASWSLFGGAGERGREQQPVAASSDQSQSPGKGTESAVVEPEAVLGPEVPHRPGSQAVFAFPSRKATELH